MKYRRRLTLGETDEEMEARLGPTLAAAVRQERTLVRIQEQIDFDAEMEAVFKRLEQIKEADRLAREGYLSQERQALVEVGWAPQGPPNAASPWELNSQTIMDMTLTGNTEFMAILSVWEVGYFSIPDREVVHASFRLVLGDLPDQIYATGMAPQRGIYLPRMTDFTWANETGHAYRIGPAAIHVGQGDVVTCSLGDLSLMPGDNATIMFGQNGVLAILD